MRIMVRKLVSEESKRKIIHTFKSTLAEAKLLENICERFKQPKSDTLRKLIIDEDARWKKSDSMLAVHQGHRLLPFSEQQAINLVVLKGKREECLARFEKLKSDIEYYESLISEWSSLPNPQQLTGAKKDGY